MAYRIMNTMPQLELPPIHLCHTGHAEKVQTDGNPGLKPMALAMPCGWPGCVDCWAADPRAARPDPDVLHVRILQPACACNAVTCIACRCADEPASRATAQPHGGARRRTRDSSANGADRPGRGTVTAHAAAEESDTASRPGTAPVAEAGAARSRESRSLYL